MCKEGGVSEVLQTRGVISHDVGSSWEEERVVTVSVLALVTALEVAQVSRGSVGADSSFVDTGESRCVVRAI